MHPTKAVINLRAIKENYRFLKANQNKKVIGVVKANGYGHGSVAVARALVEEKIDYLAVAFLKEAVVLREAGITHPILVLSVTKQEDLILASELDLTLSCFDLTWFKSIEHFDLPLKFHLKVDTGMNRLGMKTISDLEYVINQVENHPNFEIEGIYTHYATADDDYENYKMQRDRFVEVLNALQLDVPYIHTSNSAASIQYYEQFTTAIRPGLALYGLNPLATPVNLTPAFHLETSVGLVKSLKKGESVSYGYTYTAEEDQLIAVLPLGYADGWLRYHAGREVCIGDRKFPIVGRVCMDHTMIRVDETISVGDKVELIGPHISVDQVAKDLKTINYEIVCTISDRVKRYYLK